AVLQRDVCCDEAQGLAVQAQPGALVLGEQPRERLLDLGAALEVLAGLVGVVAVLGPEGGDRLGIALVEGGDERPGALEDGVAVLGLALVVFRRDAGTARQQQRHSDGQRQKQASVSHRWWSSGVYLGSGKHG